MDRNDQRNSVILFRQNSAKMTVPRMTMHNISIDVRGIEIGAPPHCAESGTQWRWASKIPRVDFKANDLEIAFLKRLVAKAAHFHRHHLRQLTRKVAHVHTGAAVDVRRILVSQKDDFHAGRSRATSGLLSTEFASEMLAPFSVALSVAILSHPPHAALYRPSLRKEYRW